MTDLELKLLYFKETSKNCSSSTGHYTEDYTEWLEERICQTPSVEKPSDEEINDKYPIPVKMPYDHENFYRRQGAKWLRDTFPLSTNQIDWEGIENKLEKHLNRKLEEGEDRMGLFQLLDWIKQLPEFSFPLYDKEGGGHKRMFEGSKPMEGPELKALYKAMKKQREDGYDVLGNQPIEKGEIKSPDINYSQLCPKCNGQGIVQKPPYVPGDVNEWVQSQLTFTCDVCNGAKIISSFPTPGEVDWEKMEKKFKNWCFENEIHFKPKIWEWIESHPEFSNHFKSKWIPMEDFKAEEGVYHYFGRLENGYSRTVTLRGTQWFFATGDIVSPGNPLTHIMKIPPL